MDIREYTSPTLPVAQFVERYVDTDHYDAGCRGCDNYGQVWVCPPYDFSVPDYWGGFREVCLRGVQLRFSPEEQAAAMIRRSWRSDYGSCSPGRPGR